MIIDRYIAPASSQELEKRGLRLIDTKVARPQDVIEMVHIATSSPSYIQLSDVENPNNQQLVTDQNNIAGYRIVKDGVKNRSVFTYDRNDFTQGITPLEIVQTTSGEITIEGSSPVYYTTSFDYSNFPGTFLFNQGISIVNSPSQFIESCSLLRSVQEQTGENISVVFKLTGTGKELLKRHYPDEIDFDIIQIICRKETTLTSNEPTVPFEDDDYYPFKLNKGPLTKMQNLLGIDFLAMEDRSDSTILHVGFGNGLYWNMVLGKRVLKDSYPIALLNPDLHSISITGSQINLEYVISMRNLHPSK